MIGPDFLCIGAQKAGTRWLYDQLQWHPDFWMPPIKELHFFDGRFTKHFTQHYERIYRNALNDLSKVNERRKKQAGRPLDERDKDFLIRAKRLADSESQSLDDYLRLFEMSGTKITGDITPAYSILRKNEIKQIRSALPALKIIFIVRDPISRVWSHYCMLEKEDKTFPFSELTADRFMEFLKRDNVMARSFPSKTITRWKEYYPNMLTWLFDDIRDHPDSSRQEILKYLGATPAAEKIPIDSDFNRKSKGKKREMPEDIRAILEEYFKKEIEWCKANIGGATSSWS
ncbi:sulfotransferase [Natronospira bacteriovora]|uniref:Sulfotransferase n=1 Tax=Natronospira bacteriovora TaxID=3069753 RepID=A0ABU0W7X8_9GAMM|nr:sulfotransferase [Natronospira sp. AB-CW4]MDQ2070134.1 sulfotransferase [Natronospira sp. AB-CW4]